MLTPSQFARIAVTHGTVATVSDPHEIANVMGIVGIEFMLNDAARVPLKFCFGAPSCVPATTFETTGATIDAAQVRELLRRDEIGYLAEMMNFPGVLAGDTEVVEKIRAAQEQSKPRRWPCTGTARRGRSTVLSVGNLDRPRMLDAYRSDRQNRTWRTDSDPRRIRGPQLRRLATADRSVSRSNHVLQ